MRNSNWIVLATLLTSVCAFLQGANASTSVGDAIPLNMQYSHHKGPCPQDVVDALPLTLTYEASIRNKLELTAVSTHSADDVALGDPLFFAKEGIDGERAFMSIGVTDLNVGNKTYPLSQLWLEQEKGVPLKPWSSAFYVDKNKTCLIMHDLKAADNPLAKPR